MQICFKPFVRLFCESLKFFFAVKENTTGINVLKKINSFANKI